jgi:TonB family protein
MNRLQKHCVLVSTGLHLLLLVALLFGSGFRSKQPERPDIKSFHMMSSSVMESLLDDPADAAGKQEPEPVIKTPVAEPPPEEIKEPETPKAEPAPRPEPVVKPRPKPEPAKVPAISKRIEKPKPKPAKPVIKVSRIYKSNTSRRKPSAKTQQPRVPRPSVPQVTLNQNLNKVGGGSRLKGVTTISGSSLGKYGLLVQSAYDRQWRQPNGISSRDLTVKVKVIVAKDGSIQSAKISQSSGISAMDQSIERAIQMVQRIAEAPPKGASLSNRTFILNFNLKY